MGKDARAIEALVYGVHLHNSNYKLVGLPFWSAVSWAELSLLDLLGRVAGNWWASCWAAHRFAPRSPCTWSSTDRGTTPEQEVSRFAKRRWQRPAPGP